MKSPWRKFLNFSAADQRVLVLLSGIVIGVLLTSLCLWLGEGRYIESAEDDSIYAYDDFFNTLRRDTLQEVSRYYRQEEQRVVETFAFDPNTADSTTLLRLGLSPWQVRNIYSYRAKGGKYHRAEDFSRLYGLTKGDYDRLKPYIRIADAYKLMSDLPQATPAKPVAVADTASVPSPVYVRKFDEGTQVDINTADTSVLKRIPGIGTYYARRIVNYRNQLGGFVSLSQLSEIEGLPKDIERWFTQPDTAPVKRLYLNRATLDGLNRHPYLNFYQSKVIIEHRRKYGMIKDLQSLSFYEEFTPGDLERLAPYVAFDE